MKILSTKAFKSLKGTISSLQETVKELQGQIEALNSEVVRLTPLRDSKGRYTKRS